VTGILSEIGLARALHDLQRFDEARGVLEQAGDRHPDRADLLQFWLACARHTRNPTAALQWVAKRLQRNPSDHEAWFAGGQILYGVGLFEQARTWFGRATGGLADPAPALAFYAECFLHEADLEGALEIACQAPDEPRAQAVIAAVSLAAEAEVPGFVRCAEADVRSAFRRLLANLRRTPGRAVVEKIEAVCASMAVFDPAGLALATSALEP
jgi:thioredoxin-like negative regulator of GroEL